MKKILLSAALLTAAITASADFTDSGYYRAQNAKSERYGYLLDNKGSYNTHTSSADVQALELYTGFLRASSDPATVFYITKEAENASRGIYTIDIAGQGTSIHQFLDAYLKLWKQKDYNGKMSYLLYAEKSGMVKYVGDILHSDDDKGFASADAKNDDRLWWCDRISASSADNYFGIAPTLTAGGKYYYPFYAAFDYGAYSDGVKFYTISKVENGVAVLNPLSGVVPAATPVIVECSHPLATDNRLDIGASGSKADVSGNKLGGVYFNNDDPIHNNRTKYDKNTMRILAVKGGKLVFETPSNLSYLPRNQAYLKVASGTAADVQVMTQAEYDVYLQQLEYERNLITAITLTPSSANVEKGSSVSLTAATTPAQPSNPGLTWSSSNPAIASVDSKGKVTALAAGSATITVSSDNNVKATAKITVTVAPASVSIENGPFSLEKGAAVTLEATVGPDDCTDKSVTWSSSDPAVATVDQNGVMRAVGAGSAVVTVKTSNGKTADANVTVYVSPASITLDFTTLNIEKGESARLTATVGPDDCTDKSITWSTDNADVATVDQSGNVTAVKTGSAVISAKTSNGMTATCTVGVYMTAENITLDQTYIVLEKGESATLVAAVGPEDATDKSVTWSSDNESVVSVDSDGTVTALAAGSATITATNANGNAATAVVSVIVPASAIELNESAVDVIEGAKYQLIATVLPEDCTDKNITWTSSDTSVAIVDGTGLVTVLSDGTVFITATTANGLTATCALNAISGVDRIVASPDAVIYDLNGQRVSTMQRGQVYIIRLNGSSVRIVK